MKPTDQFLSLSSLYNVNVSFQQSTGYLSTAIAHLLSMISAAETIVAGKDNAAKSVLKTVIIAPSFINITATPARGYHIIS